jgi:hypothetical protein
MNKPAILNGRGDAMVEFSGWNSYANVDGVTAALWSHAFNIELDRERNRAFLTWSSVPVRQSAPQGRRMRKYELEQVVTIAAGQAAVEYYVVPNEPVRDLQLTVGLYRWYYRNLKPSAEGFAFTGTDLTRLQTEQYLQPTRFTRAMLRPVTRPDSVRTLTNEFGVYAIELSYRASAPKIYERTLVARLEVALRGGSASEP